jgi:hypothetical protein
MATDQTDWNRLSTEAQLEIMRGATAFRLIKQNEDYSHWVDVGRALLRLKTEGMRLSGSNSPHGRGYQTMYRHLASRVPDLDDIDKASRAHSMWLAENFTLVDKWHSTLAQNERTRLNHPTAIRRRYDAAHSHPPAAPRAPAGNRKDAELVRLQEELDATNKKLRARNNVTEGQDWTWHDKPADIAKAFMRLQPTKAKQVAAEVLNLAKSTTAKPRQRAG